MKKSTESVEEVRPPIESPLTVLSGNGKRKNAYDIWKFYKKRGNCNVFLLPSERNGLNLFFRELRARRTSLCHSLSLIDMDLDTLLKDIINTKYPPPVASYLTWLHQITQLKSTQKKACPHATFLTKKVLGGGNYFVGEQEEITFSKTAKQKDAVWLDQVTPAVNSLFPLWFYLQHQLNNLALEPGEVEERDILMIEDPEIFLASERKALLARLLLKITDSWQCRIIITTDDSSMLLHLGEGGAI